MKKNVTIAATVVVEQQISRLVEICYEHVANGKCQKDIYVCLCIAKLNTILKLLTTANKVRKI